MAKKKQRVNDRIGSGALGGRLLSAVGDAVGSATFGPRAFKAGKKVVKKAVKKLGKNKNIRRGVSALKLTTLGRR